MVTTAVLSSDGDEAVLDPAAEVEWQILRRQIELASGFWLGFIFSPSPRPVAVLRRRVEQIYRFHASRVRLVRPSAPGELREILPRLLEPESVEAGCIWVEAIHLDASTFTDEEPGPWATAWDWTLMRTNEHREVLRRRLNGGLVYAVPPQWKPRARIAAPDLWSIRSLVLDLPASAGGLPDANRRDTMERESAVPDSSFDTAIDVDFALAEARRIEGKPKYDPRSHARVLLRAVEGLLARGRTGKAVETAHRALLILRDAPAPGRLLPTALQRTGQAELADGDFAAAESHLDKAVNGWKSLIDKGGESPQVLRDLSISLGSLGDVRRESGELAAATEAFEESLTLRHRLLEAMGETPQSLRDLSISLGSLGDVRRESGELAAATEAFEESLTLRHRLLETVGEMPQSLRDLSISLNKLGDVRREGGDLAAATAAFEESLALDRRLLEAMGETPQSLRDLSVSLERIGGVRRESGELAAATAAFEESLSFARRRLEAYGETPQALRDLSVVLGRVGDVRRESGELAAAMDAFEESRTIEHRLRNAAGET